MYKLETHLHTVHVSKCGRMEAPELIRDYHAAGYHGIVVTDHFNRTTFEYLGIDPAAPGDKVTPFLEGYRRMREEGEKAGIRIYKGAELRFDESENDYLLYGWPDDLLGDPEAIFRMGIAAFAPIARAAGAVIVQAHPYRGKCTPAIACYLDGIETRNLNPRHDSRNDRALEYARLFDLMETSGSDCHQVVDVGCGGIMVRELPADEQALARLLLSRDYQLI